MNDLRELSRRGWSGNDTREDIILGCNLRIADAVEKMAVHHDQLMRERDVLRQRYQAVLNANEAQAKSIRSLRGYITKLKQKVAALQEQTKS